MNRCGSSIIGNKYRVLRNVCRHSGNFRPTRGTKKSFYGRSQSSNFSRLVHNINRNPLPPFRWVIGALLPLTTTQSRPVRMQLWNSLFESREIKSSPKPPETNQSPTWRAPLLHREEEGEVVHPTLPWQTVLCHVFAIP